MKDNTNIDFRYSIDRIKEELDFDINLQDKILDSDNINNTFLNIETNLNRLYENTRYLEDAIDYCESFLNIKIEDYSQQIHHTLKAIENIRDINKNSAYMEYLIPFKDDMSIKKDRNGEVISNIENKNDYLMLGMKKEEIINWLAVNKKSSYVPYSSNLENLKVEEYRSFYTEEQIANKGIVEAITVTLETPTRMNYLDIKTVNSNISNLRLVYVNGIEEYIDHSTAITPEAIVAQIKFDLVCKKYNSSSYFMLKNKLTDDVWNKIKEYEYKYAYDVNSKLEMEEVIARVQGENVNIFNNNIEDKNNIVEKKMYTYMFGIDSINIKYIQQEQDSCFISESINIGAMNKGEFIQLHTEEILNENAVVEYSLLDGDMEIPLLPYGTEIIKNEKLFATLATRFASDESDTYVIKKDGMLVDISIDDAKQQLLSRFCVDYYPVETYTYVPINNNIRIKAVLRTFNKTIDNSYISMIKIRKYGGDVLWTDM